MSDQTLSKGLIDAGWAQGVLLPALPWSVVFDPEHPLTGLAKRALGRVKPETVRAAGTPEHSIASGLTRATDYLVIATQTCDIAKKATSEETVMAMRAFVTDNSSILQAAARNSARYFLLDLNRNLVVDATIMSVIEKGVLARLSPQIGAPDDARRKRFARWIAQRFNRYAFPDPIVEAVITPLLDNLRQLQEANDPVLVALNVVEEVLITPTEGNPPYDVSILFMVQEPGLADEGLALGDLIARMREWFAPGQARLVDWDALHPYQLTLGEYLEYERVPLDYYTYQGQTIVGLEPRAFDI